MANIDYLKSIQCWDINNDRQTTAFGVFPSNREDDPAKIKDVIKKFEADLADFQQKLNDMKNNNGPKPKAYHLKKNEFIDNVPAGEETVVVLSDKPEFYNCALRARVIKGIVSIASTLYDMKKNEVYRKESAAVRLAEANRMMTNHAAVCNYLVYKATKEADYRDAYHFVQDAAPFDYEHSSLKKFLSKLAEEDRVKTCENKKKEEASYGDIDKGNKYLYDFYYDPQHPENKQIVKDATEKLQASIERLENRPADIKLDDMVFTYNIMKGIIEFAKALCPKDKEMRVAVKYCLFNKAMITSNNYYNCKLRELKEFINEILADKLLSKEEKEAIAKLVNQKHRVETQSKRREDYAKMRNEALKEIDVILASERLAVVTNAQGIETLKNPSAVKGNPKYAAEFEMGHLQFRKDVMGLKQELQAANFTKVKTDKLNVSNHVKYDGSLYTVTENMKKMNELLDNFDLKAEDDQRKAQKEISDQFPNLKRVRPELFDAQPQGAAPAQPAQKNEPVNAPQGNPPAVVPQAQKNGPVNALQGNPPVAAPQAQKNEPVNAQQGKPPAQQAQPVNAQQGKPNQPVPPAHDKKAEPPVIVAPKPIKTLPFSVDDLYDGDEEPAAPPAPNTVANPPPAAAPQQAPQQDLSKLAMSEEEFQAFLKKSEEDHKLANPIANGAQAPAVVAQNAAVAPPQNAVQQHPHQAMAIDDDAEFQAFLKKTEDDHKQANPIANGGPALAQAPQNSGAPKIVPVPPSAQQHPHKDMAIDDEDQLQAFIKSTEPKTTTEPALNDAQPPKPNNQVENNEGPKKIEEPQQPQPVTTKTENDEKKEDLEPKKEPVKLTKWQRFKQFCSKVWHKICCCFYRKPKEEIEGIFNNS